jgi:hypothetical protein
MNKKFISLGNRLYISLDNKIYSKNITSPILIESLEKAVSGKEKSGHRYTKRVPKAGGGFTYYYADDKDKQSKTEDKEPEKKPGEKKELKTELSENHIETIKNTLKKVANILAQALSGKDPNAPAAEAVESTGENLQREQKKVAKKKIIPSDKEQKKDEKSENKNPKDKGVKK